MRIMLIVNEFPGQKVAGTAVATLGLSSALAKRGHDVHVVVTTSHPNARNGEIEPRLRVTWLKDRPVKGIGVLWRLVLVLQVACAWRPDILQGQAVSCGFLVAMIGRCLGIPSITYAQGYDVYQAGALQLRTEIRWACRWSSSVVAVTRHLASRLAEISPCADVLVIPHGFNPESSSRPRSMIRDEWGVPSNVKVVLTVGRLEPFKGQDVLLNAWPLVKDEMPKAVLWIVGNGSMRASLEEQTIRLRINDSVRLVGQKQPREIAECMSAADLFVLPSRSEPFGIVLLEAMSHGLPVVASRVGGVPEVLPAQLDAILTPPEDVRELAYAIVLGLRSGIYPSQTNCQWAMRFAWDENVHHFEDMYRSMVQ